jgi:hypothetical protein
MAIEATDAIALMGYDLSKFETVDDFKVQVEKDWVKTGDAHLNKDIAGRVFGKQNNVFRSTLNKVGKELGVDIDFSEMDPIEGINALKENIAETKAAWEKAKGDGSTNAEVIEAKRQYEEAKKANADLKKALDATTSEYTEFKTTIAQKEATAKLEGIRARGMEGVPFAPSISNLAKVGFDAMVRKELLIAFDDEGNEDVTDPSGERIKDPSKASARLTYDQAVLAIAEREGLTTPEPTPQPVRKTISTLSPNDPKQATNQEPVRQVRKLAAR